MTKEHGAFSASLWFYNSCLKGIRIENRNYISETLNSLGNNSDDILGSEFQLYQDRLEIKGRMKLLNIQIQKTKLNIKDWDKKKGLEELDKIFVFFNYTVQTIRSISNNNLID